MTVNEAFETLKENLCGMCAYGSQCMESCDIRSCDNRDAIKALEQTFCKNAEYEKDLNEMKEQILKEGNTLLTKRDLLERFCEIDKEYNGHPWNLLQILANINILIGQEPRTGHWILLDECSNSGYYCSECYKKVVKEGWSNTVKKIKFCPNCGARMVEPQKRSDKE